MPIRRIILLFLASMLLLLTFIFLTSLPQQKSFLKSELVSQLTQSDMVTNSLLLSMATEMPELKTYLQQNDITAPPLSHLFLHLTSGVTPNDYTSLLQVEMPGLDAYAKGTNISSNGNLADMPIESPPPDFDRLLKEDSDQNHEKEPDDNDKPKKDDGKKEVFIYHSHAMESFLPLLSDKNKPSQASSTDNKKNVVYVGSLLTDKLGNAGIRTAHDTTNVTAALNKKGWNFYDAYRLSRETVKTAQNEHDDLHYFVDIHRDAQRKKITTAKIGKESYAKIFFTIGVAHKNYKKNLQFAKDLNKQMEKKYPGVSRGIYQKDKSQGNGIYNQDLSDRSILIEVGGVDNTKKELKNTTDALADVLSDYIKQAEKVDG